MSNDQHETLVEKGREVIQQAPQLFIDLDVESDGKPGYGSLLSIGAITPWGETFYRELKPTSDVWIDANRDFCEKHHLERARLLVEGIEPSVAVKELIDWSEAIRKKYEKIGSVIVAFNASFDYPWVDLEITKAGTPSPYGVAGYCVKSLAMQFSETCDWKKTAKNNLPKEFLPEGDFTHNALEDAIYQQKMHFAMVGKSALLRNNRQ